MLDWWPKQPHPLTFDDVRSIKGIKNRWKIIKTNWKSLSLVEKIVFIVVLVMATAFAIMPLI